MEARRMAKKLVPQKKPNGKANNGKSVDEARNWTVMIFLAADNNLALEMVYALKEMHRVGTPRGLNVFVTYDADGDFVRFKIPKTTQTMSSLKPNLNSPQPGLDFGLLSPLPSSALPATQPVKALKKTKPARKINPQLDETLVKFMYNTINRGGPDRRYMLVLSGHGSGAVGDFLSSDVPSSRLTIPRLGRIFRAVRRHLNKKKFKTEFKIDLLGFDSCVMSMAEVVYEVQPYVKVMIGNEGLDPSTGWNYAAVLDRLRQNPTADEKDLSKAIVLDYISYYKDYVLGDISVDQSALDLTGDKVKGLHTALTELSGQLSKALQSRRTREAILLAHWEAQSYKFEQYTDLYDFCELIAKRLPKLNDSCSEVMKAIDAMTLFSDHAGAAFQRSHGLSVFFPWANIEDPDGTRDLDYYARLRFADDNPDFSETYPKNGWLAFLENYLKSTQTPPIGKAPFVSSRLNRRSITLGGGKLGTPSNDKLGTPSNDKLGTPSNDKGSLASNITAKIGQMKNPPIQFKR